MSLLVMATEARQPKSKVALVAGIILAALLTVMLIGQLFTYEKFPDVIQGFGLFPDREIASIVAALIVTGEVATLPFLLRMRLSPLARVVSMVAGWLTLIWWMYLSYWLNSTAYLFSNSGVLGDTVKLPIGWWMASFFIGLVALDFWACYGMWPAKPTFKK